MTSIESFLSVTLRPASRRAGLRDALWQGGAQTRKEKKYASAPCGTCISTAKASIDAECRPRPIRAFLLGLGVIATFAVAFLALTAMVNPALADPPPHAPSAERQLELTRFVRQECGFCHGLKLTGGLGSPLTSHALAGKPRESLEATILYGRTGTAMPGWAPHLSETDAAWIVTMLLKGFPE